LAKDKDKDKGKGLPPSKGKYEALKAFKEFQKSRGTKEEEPGKEEVGKETEEDKKVLTLIKELENDLLALKGRTETKNLDAMFQEASDALKDGDHKGAMDMVGKLREELDKVIEKHIEQRFFDAEMLIIELEVVGIDVSSSKSIVESGKKTLKEKKIKEALALADQAGTEVEKLQRQQVMEVMTYANSIIESLKAFHVDVAAFEAKAEETKKELEAKHFENAMGMVIDLEGNVSHFRVQKFDELISQTEGIIFEKEEAGKDVTEAQGMLKRAKQAKGIKDFEAASEYLIEARYAADKEAGLEFKAKSGLKQAQERFEETSGTGVCSLSCQEHLALAAKAIESKNFDEGLMEAKKAEAALLTAMREHDRIVKRIGSVVAAKELAKGFGCDLMETDGLLEQARASLAKGEFELAQDFEMQADEELGRSVQIKAKAEREQLLEAAKVVHDGKVDGQLTEAMELITLGKMERGFQLMQKVRSRLTGTVEKIDQLKGSLAALQESLERLALEGVDISEAMDIIERVQGAMGEGDFAKARSEFYHAERLVGQWTSDRVYDTLCGIEKDLGAFERFGLPPPAVDDMLNESWSLFVRGERGKASEISEQLRKSIGDYKKGFMSAMDSIQTAQHRIHHAFVMGIDINGAVTTLDKAFDQVVGVDFPAGTETANKAMAEVLSAEEKAVGELLRSTEEMIVDMESNFQVPLARDRFSRAKALLELGAFFNAYTELRQAADHVTNLKEGLQNLDTNFEEVSSLLHMGEAMDVEIVPFRDLVEEARTNKATGNLAMAVSLLGQVREDVMEIYGTRISEKKELVSGLIKDLEAKRVDVEEPRNGLKDSEGHLASKDFINAFISLSDAHKFLLELKERHEQATKALADLSSRLERAEGRKLDARRSKEKLGKAQAALASGQLSEAIDASAEADSDLNDALASNVDKMLKKDLEDWIDRARAFNIKVKEGERFLELAKGERDGEDYEAALKNIDNGVALCKGAIAKVLDSQMEEAGEAIVEARDAGISPGPVAKMLDKANRAVEDERYEDAAKVLGDLKSGLAAQRENHSKAQVVLEECEKKIQTYQQEGANLRTAVETLDAARQSMTSGEYDIAMDLISQSSDTADNVHNSYIEAKSSIEEALSIIEQLTELDLDTLALTEASTKVYDNIDSGDYSTAIEAAFDLRDRAEKLRTEHYEGRIKELKEKMDSEAARNEDVSDLRDHIANLEAALMSREYDGLTKKVDDGHTILAEIGQRYEAENKRLAAMEKELAKVEKKGVILLDARRLLDEAKGQLEGKDYKAMGKTLDGARAAASAAEVAKAQAKEALDRCTDALEVPFEEVDTEQLVGLSADAHTRFDEGHYGEARTLANNAVEESKRLQTGLVSTKLAEWEALRDEAEAEGVNVGPAKERIKDVPELIKDGAFVPAYDICKEAHETATRLRGEHAKAKKLLDELEAALVESKAMTIGTEALEESVKDIKDAFTLPDYNAGAELAQHSLEDLASERASFFTALAGSLEEAITDAKGMQVPVNKPSELLKEAQGLLDTKDYLEAHRRFVDAQKALEQVRKGFEETSAKMAELETAVAEAKDNSVAVEKIEAVLAKSREALADARFDVAEKGMNGARDGLNKAWKNTASKRMDEVQEEMKRLEGLGVPMDDAKDLFQGAGSALELNEFKEVLAICGTTMEMVNARRQEHDRARLAVEEARTVVDGLEGVPAGLDGPRSKLENAEALIKDGKLDDAETEAKAVMAEVDTVMGAFLRDRLDKVQGEVDDALQSGARSADLDFTTKAVEALSEKRYRDSWDVIAKGEEALKDVLKAYRAARGALEAATNLVYEAEQELDLASALECIDQASQALDSGDYTATEEMSKRAVEELTKATKHHLDGQLSTTELLIRRLEMGGKVKLAEAEKLHAEAKAAFEKDDLVAAKAMLKKAARDAKRSRANYEIAREVLTALDDIFSATTLNLNVMKKGRERAKAAFERDYERILEREEEVLPAGPVAIQLILQYQVKFEESINIDMDITKGRKILSDAKAALEENDYDSAVKLAKECYETVRQSERAATMRTLITMQERLDELKDRCVDCSIQENLLDRARAAANEGDTGTSFKYMNECNESLKGLKDEHRETAEAIRHAESALLLAGHMGVEAPAAYEMLASANTMMGDSDFESARDLSRQGLEEVYRAKHEKVAARHGEIAAYLEGVEKDGVPVHRAKHLLKKSRDLLEIQDYVRALHLAERAEAEAKQMATMHSEVKDVMAATNEKIEYAKSLGVEMAAIEQLQARMGAVLATGKHEKVKELSAEIEGELLSKIVEECNRAIREAQDKIKEAEGLGLKVDDLKAEVGTANKALEEEDFDTVMSTAKGLLGKVDGLMATEVTTRLDKLKAHMADATAAGLTVDGSEAMVQAAEEAIAAGETKTALEKLNTLGEALKAGRLKKVKELLSASDKMIKAGEKEKVDVFQAKGFLDEANDALGREELDEAFDFAVQAYDGVKNVHLTYMNGILAMSKQVLELAVETGGDTKRVETFLQKTQELMDNENFDRALFYAKQCAREADRLQFKLIQSMVAKLESDVKADEGKDFTKAKELLEEAKSAMLTKKYDQARETVLKCRDEILHAGAPVPEQPPKPEEVLAVPGKCPNCSEDIEEGFKACPSCGFSLGAAPGPAEEAKPQEPKPTEAKPPEPVLPEPVPVPVPEVKPAPPPAEPKPVEGMDALFKAAEAQLAEAEDMGLDVQVYRMEVRRARGAVNEGRPSEAETLLKGIPDHLKASVAAYKDVDALVSEVDRYLTIAVNYSFDISNPQGIYQQGLDQRKTNLASALETLKRAKLEVLALLEGVYPYITFDMAKDKPLGSGSWNEIYFYVSNTGNILARDLVITVEGAELDGDVLIQKINIGETREIPVKLKPSGSGQQGLKVKVVFLRDFDSRSYMAEFPQTVTVLPASSGGLAPVSIGGSSRPKPNATKASEMGASRCQLCQGEIKEGQFRISCSCGKDYHETCASKIGDCVFCNKPLRNTR